MSHKSPCYCEKHQCVVDQSYDGCTGHIWLDICYHAIIGGSNIDPQYPTNCSKATSQNCKPHERKESDHVSVSVIDRPNAEEEEQSCTCNGEGVQIVGSSLDLYAISYRCSWMMCREPIAAARKFNDWLSNSVAISTKAIDPSLKWSLVDGSLIGIGHTPWDEVCDGWCADGNFEE